jgi:hypothetical protein
MQLGGSLLRHDIGVGAKEIFEEVLIAFGRGAEQVGTPQGQRAGPVLGRIDVVHRHLDRPRSQLVGDVRRNIRSLTLGHRGLGAVSKVQRIDVELRIERHPSQPR